MPHSEPEPEPEPEPETKATDNGDHTVLYEEVHRFVSGERLVKDEHGKVWLIMEMKEVL